MDKLEQEIKDRLAQSTSMEGIDSEALWNGISKTINPAEAPSKNRRFMFIWFFLFLVSIGSIWALLTLKEDSSSAYSPRIEPKTEQFLSDALGITQEDSLVASLKEKTPSSVTLISEIEHEKSTFHMNEVTRLASKGMREQENGFQNRKGFSKKPSNTSSFFSQVESNQQAEQKNLSGGDQKFGDLSFGTGVPSKADYANKKLFDVYIADTGLMQRKSPPNDAPLFIPPNPNESLIASKSVQPVSKKTISWGIYGGAVLLQNNFKNGNSDFADSLNKNLSMYPGNSIGVLVRIKQGKNWNVSVGVEYLEWKDRFDKVIVSDSLVEIDQKQVLVQNIRTVRHFNTASIITLPVQLEISKDIERFRLGMNLGVSYSLILSQNGRLLKDDFTIVNYSQSEKRFNDFLSARFAPYIGFKLNGKVMVGAICNVGIQGHGINSINQLKNTSVAVMPSIGLTFNY